MFIVQIDNDELFHVHVHIQKDPIKPKNIFFFQKGPPAFIEELDYGTRD